MKLDYVRPLSPALCTFTQSQSQIRITTADEQTYVDDCLDACTEHAEKALDSSLLTRTITGTYYGTSGAYTLGQNPYQRFIDLPMGPVVSVDSVIDSLGNDIAYEWQRQGNTDQLKINASFIQPLTVEYTAGYGTEAADVPSDIRMAIRMHVATLFETRTSIDEKAMLPVPHTLETFYARRRRTPPVA